MIKDVTDKAIKGNCPTGDENILVEKLSYQAGKGLLCFQHHNEKRREQE